jgi:hypothetical protein
MRECVCTKIAKVDISLYTIETEMPAQINSFILKKKKLFIWAGISVSIVYNEISTLAIFVHTHSHFKDL